MISQYRHLTAGLMAGMAIFSLSPAQAAIKCWVNDQGQKECGNRVPPKYSQEGHTTIDGRGLVIDEIKAAPSAEELDKRRKLEFELEQKRAEMEEIKRKDRVLLDTFPEEGDIIRSRDSKITTISSQILLENEKLKKINKQLAGAQQRKQKYVDKDGEVPEVLQKNIADYERQIKNAKEYIEQSNKDKNTIKAEYDAYLARHRELSGITKDKK